MKKLLIFDYKNSEKSFFKTLKLDGFEIKFFEERLNEDTVKKISEEDKQNAEVVSMFITSDVNKDVLDEFKNLKLIATRSTGYNHIDLKECTNRGIAVANVSSYGETTVAQYTMGLIIALIRKIIPAFLDLKRMENRSQEYVGRDLNSLTVGVLGTGAIGTKVCKIANAFDMKILAYDFKPNCELSSKYNVEYTDLDTVLSQSDIISLHVPYNDSNYHFIDKKKINKMKQGAYLINTSRGELIDTKALYQALIDKKLTGCALDVGECESFSFDTENLLENIPGTSANCLARAFITQKLIELPNVIVTPHIAYNTEEAIQTILETTIKNIEFFYKGEASNRIV